jgi:hypothetical protein
MLGRQLEILAAAIGYQGTDEWSLAHWQSRRLKRDLDTALIAARLRGRAA